MAGGHFPMLTFVNRLCTVADVEQLLLALVAFNSLVLVATAVAVVLVLRRPPVLSRDPDVDELAIQVERLSKASRRERMQRVRASAGDADDDAPPALRAAAPAVPSITNRKAQLRARVRERA